MATNYASLAFTDAIKALQERAGSRQVYARVEQQSTFNGLMQREINFIQERDSFYLASIGENGFPYIQHRGGPKGFLRVLDSQTIGFTDYRGNKQYISAGNILTHPQVSLILMDYARRTRLKIYAEAEIIELADRPDLLSQLDSTDSEHTSERMVLLHVRAYDWNCPQYITPRYTIDEINEVLVPLKEYIAQLEAKVEVLSKEKNQTNR
ncbi:pyridoxamine 5'-phosphate oxidase family protein [Spirosoma aureum]|uniref:Pyridoxamine 5'-phosphate oxidase family protein n=1 Tax=Spirosoma aureum TaxID=2692134 RepID=A0A6G9AHW2_9BACT|nr:pyridoxamine 5'-phosphate oxidase family protein [Spirosoma aureum]QIP12062.1 pyridoxamine 5'-phosphate oxidase family protein [Spirosoma aureum]